VVGRFRASQLLPYFYSKNATTLLSD